MRPHDPKLVPHTQERAARVDAERIVPDRYRRIHELMGRQGNCRSVEGAVEPAEARGDKGKKGVHTVFLAYIRGHETPLPPRLLNETCTFGPRLEPVRDDHRGTFPRQGEGG